MDTLSVRRMTTRCRLPARDGAASRARLDAALAQMLSGTLEATLEHSGVRAEEEICVRRVHAAVRLAARRSDAALGADWSAAIAAALHRTLADAAARGDAVDFDAAPGSAANSAAARSADAAVVRYGSRAQAWIDCAQGVACGDLRRAWAWRRMGLWRAGDGAGLSTATAELVRALGLSGERIVPVFVALARSAMLGRLARRLDEPAWRLLAAAALEAHGASRALLEPAPPPRTESAADIPPPTPRHAGASGAAPAAPADSAAEAAAAALVRSPLAGLVAFADAATAPAIAVLVALAHDPAVAQLGLASAQRRLALLAGALAMAGGTKPATPVAVPPAAPTNTRRSQGAAQHLPAVQDEAAARQLVDATADDAAPTSIHVRTRAGTEWGGLLLLLNVLEPAGVIAARPPALERRSLRWTLHRLAQALAPVAADDAAALAFAGLAPDAAPPSHDAEPASEAELGGVAELAAAVVARLRRALELPDGPDQAVLQRVCRRPALIVVDPGWIEVRFALAALATDIRRAGLDLHPDWLPWLGSVVRFVYE